MPQPTQPAVAIRGLGLTIGGAVILDSIDLTVEPGRMLGVIGPNGAGKTTLFNAISGVTRPTAGTIEIEGIDVTTMPIHRRARVGLGRTFQTSSLFPELSVLENVRIAAQVPRGGSLSLLRFPRPGDEAHEVARACLDEVHLSHRLDTLAGGLSHGEKRKLEIAVLLAQDPRVILLDEPMAGVASGDVDSVTEVIGAIHRERGCTVLMVEHHLHVLLGLVDEVAVMHHGQLLAQGSAEQIMDDPVVKDAYLGVGA